MSNTPKIAIQVNFKKRTYHSVGGGLYKCDQDGTYWERPKIDGVRTMRKVQGRNERAARIVLGNRRAKQAMAAEDLAIDPYKRTSKAQFKELAEFYLESGCPKQDESARVDKQLTDEKSRVAHLVNFFGSREWDKITIDDWRSYANHRKALVKAKFRTGNRVGYRAIDLERATASSIFRWAMRSPARTGVTENPFRNDFPRFQRSSMVRHCRDCQPANADELHQLAGLLLAERDSESLGWQMLFEAFVGQRTHEILTLRIDAKPREAGFIETKKIGKTVQPWKLHLFRSETHKGTFDHILIHPALREALQVHHDWHQERFPNSPWYFPSPDDPSRPVDKNSLTKALARITKALGLPTRTSHGLRSYHVNVLRSDRDDDGNPKLSDAEIGLRIGHKSGGKLIVDVYGTIGDKISFMPQKQPVAWAKFLRGRPVQLDLAL
jgi:integrase